MVKKMIGSLSKRHSAPARKQRVYKRTRENPPVITQSIILTQSKPGR